MRHSFWVSLFTHRPHTNKSCKEIAISAHFIHHIRQEKESEEKSIGFSTEWHMALWVKLWNDNNDAIRNKRVQDNQLESENSSYVIKNFTTIFTAKHFSWFMPQSYSVVWLFKVEKKLNFFVFVSTHIRTHQKAVLFTCCARLIQWKTEHFAFAISNSIVIWNFSLCRIWTHIVLFSMHVNVCVCFMLSFSVSLEFAFLRCIALVEHTKSRNEEQLFCLWQCSGANDLWAL